MIGSPGSIVLDMTGQSLSYIRYKTRQFVELYEINLNDLVIYASGMWMKKSGKEWVPDFLRANCYVGHVRQKNITLHFYSSYAKGRTKKIIMRPLDRPVPIPDGTSFKSFLRLEYCPTCERPSKIWLPNPLRVGERAPDFSVKAIQDHADFLSEEGSIYSLLGRNYVTSPEETSAQKSDSQDD